LFLHRFGGAFEGKVIEAVDPGGTIAGYIDNDRVIGTVVYPASTLVSPGIVKVIEGNRFTLGELDGTKSPRVLALSQALTEAKFKAPVSSDIRSEIWLKLMGNVVFNPISALSHASLVEICQFAPTRTLAAAMMAEAQAIAEKLGLKIRISIEKRIAGAEAVGAHKTSMLQDLEAGRPLELDALVGSLVELAHATATPIPAIEAIFATTSLLDKVMRKT
jgi:2-dehydropantoate 2-reductase